MISKKWLQAVSVAGVLALGLAACGGNGNNGGPGDGGMTGSVRIDGSSTVAPLSEVAADAYMEENPGVRVTVAVSGTSGGFQKFCIGETDMNDSSRAIKQSEIDLCGENGIGYDSIQVANDALSLVVNPDNPVDCLAVTQVNQIWDLDSSVQTWGDVDGLDIPAEMAGERITLYGPGTDSGTFDFFTEAINGEEGRIRTDYTDIGEDDQAAIVGVQGDRYAMGYIPYSFVQEAGDAVKPLLVDNGAGCVDGTLDNVQNGSYTPLGRPLFVYASDTALARAEVLDFMEFYIDNAEFVAETAGFVPLTTAQMDEQRAKLAALAGG